MIACVHLEQPDRERLLCCADAFSPWAELLPDGAVLFSVAELRRLYAGPHELARAIADRIGPEAHVAIAPNADAAVLAARNFPGITVIPENAGDRLAQIDIEHLPISTELGELLQRWGVHTFGDMAALPEAGIAERFGPDGVRLQRLARGTIQRPLAIHQPEVRFEDRIELDDPVALLEPLLFLLARILNEQCARLLSHGLATNELQTRLALENGGEHVRTLYLPVPMRESKALLKLLQMDLDAHPPQAAAVAIALALRPAAPRPVQSGLFLPLSPEPEKLELTLARIRALLGEENAGVPELLETHRPAPFRLAPNRLPAREDSLPPAQSATRLVTAFRYISPAPAARVETRENRPVRIAAPGISGKVISVAGPWRTSGGWWTNEPWSRDEWDVALDTGALYRIFKEPGQRWFIEGSYD